MWEKMRTIALSERTFNIEELENSKLFVSPSGYLGIFVTTKCKFAYFLALQWPYLLCQETNYRILLPKFTAKIAFKICSHLSLCTRFLLIPPLLQRVCLLIFMHRTMVTWLSLLCGCAYTLSLQRENIHVRIHSFCCVFLKWMNTNFKS